MKRSNGGLVVPGESEEGQLLSRFLLGLLLLGSDELLTRLRALQGEIEGSVELAAGQVVPGDETTAELLGYLAVGMFLRGQKRLSGSIRRGVRRSIQATGQALSLLDRLTDNALGRPLRQPVERRLWNLALEGQRAIGEGRRQTQNARLLAGRTLDQVVNDLTAYLIENPELMDLIRRQVAEQSTGLAGTAMDSARQLGVGADGTVEGAVRRVLRRQPRQELPPSPLPADPQAVYSRRTSPGEEDDGG